METFVVQCLRCGTSRATQRDVFKHLDAPECPECGYLGWAPAVELTDADRRRHRKRRVARRGRLASVA